MRAVACAAVLAVCAGVVGFGTLPLREQWLVQRADAGEAPEVGLLWAAVAARSVARSLLRSEAIGGESLAAGLLDDSTRIRPLHAPSWLDRALAEANRGEWEIAQRHLDVSETLWPGRRRHLWRLARARIQLGDGQGGLRVLRSVLRADPDRTLEAFALAGSVEPDPGERIRALLPAKGDAPTRDDHLGRLLRKKCGPAGRALADAAWLALSHAARAERQTASWYVGCLVDLGDWQAAGALWDRHAPGGRSTARVTNGGFEHAPVQSGLGWRIGAPAGAPWRRDERVSSEGGSSLRIDFDGSRDLDYHHASQLVLVAPGRRYRLSARWRAESLASTTRPYLEVVSREPGQPLRAMSRAPAAKSFGWSPVSIDFQTGDRTHLLLVRLRRDPAATPGARISGRLWLDAVHLAPMDRETPGE